VNNERLNSNATIHQNYCHEPGIVLAFRCTAAATAADAAWSAWESLQSGNDVGTSC